MRALITHRDIIFSYEEIRDRRGKIVLERSIIEYIKDEFQKEL